MKYQTEIDGHAFTLDLEERDGRLRVIIGEREYQLHVVQPERGVYLIFDGDKVYEATVSPGGPGLLSIKLGGRQFSARVIDRKHRGPGSEHALEGQQLLTAPMPGKVVRVLLHQGDQVASGQGVVVVEAMKMQNEIQSPKPGRVVEIRVAEGDTVNANQVVAVVEYPFSSIYPKSFAQRRIRIGSSVDKDGVTSPKLRHCSELGLTYFSWHSGCSVETQTARNRCREGWREKWTPIEFGT